jgi:hypothetical protein
VWDVILPFWVIMRSGRWNVMNHIASRGVIFGRSFFGARGFFLPWVILRRERHHDHIWISNFLWRQFRVVETCPYMAYGRGLPIYGSLHMFLGGLKCPPPYYSKMLNKPTDPLLVTRIESWLSPQSHSRTLMQCAPPPPHPYKTCPHFLVPWKSCSPILNWTFMWDINTKNVIVTYEWNTTRNEMFVDTKGVIRKHNAKKRQCNGK